MGQSNNPRFADALKRLLNLKAPSPLDPLDDLFPTFPVWDQTKRENDFVRNERRWVSRNTDPGAPATNSFIRLENPLSSGLLCCVDLVTFTMFQAQGLSISLQQSVGVGATAGQDTRPLDGRGYSTLGNNSGMDCRHGNRGAALNLGIPVTASALAGATGSNFFGCGDSPGIFVLPPGWALEVEGSTVQNDQLTVGFLYRVRGVEPSEVTP